MVDFNNLYVIVVSKATPIGNRVVPELLLLTGDEVPIEELKAPTETLRAFFEDQARLILEGFLNSLPGGTISALTVALMKHDISVRIVSEIDSADKPGIY
jgi:hypothetical protein